MTLYAGIDQHARHLTVCVRDEAGARAVRLPGVRRSGEFLRTFGKPDRLLTCECERSESTTLAQAFQMINGEVMRRKLEAPDNRIGRLLDEKLPASRIVEELYLATLCRAPTDRERTAAVAHVESADNPRAGLEDVAWSLVNAKEFLLIH